jgi:hypothetical protein
MADEPQRDETIEDDTIFTCWCGAEGTHDELFSDFLEESCNGSGSLRCYCGGDLCVCHNHGSTDCPGCEDCEPERYEWDYEGE